MLAPTLDPTAKADVRLESWIEALPSNGYLPVTIHISNGDAKPHTWTVSSLSGYGVSEGLNSSVEVTVEPGRTVERLMLAPVASQTGRGYYYGGLNFTVSGYGVRSPNAGSVNHVSTYGSNRTGFIGMSRAVASRHWSALRDKLDSSGAKSSSSRSDLDGSQVDMASAPAEWRGYAGFAQLWMDEAEWLAVRPEVKAAMLDWVSMGGRVYVLATEDSDARADQLGLPPKVGASRPRGAGEIVLKPWSRAGNPLEEMAAEIRRSDTTSLRAQLDNYDTAFGLRKLVGNLALKGGLIFGFIAVFAVLVGPVNLFWLAPPGRRQRMFWTTPLLSLGSSLVLLVIMLLQDGVGGSGARLSLVILQPDQKRMAVVQEQVCRTGVLLKRDFPIVEPGWMQTLKFERAGTLRGSREARYSLWEGEESRSGDWFASRSLQAHLLETVRPTRAFVEVFPGAAGQPPSVLSNLESPLKIVFVVDENDAVWMAEDVGTGEKKPLKASNRARIETWSKDGPQQYAGPVISDALKAFEPRAGLVLAEATLAAKFATPTLSSIRWTNDYAILAGPYVKH